MRGHQGHCPPDDDYEVEDNTKYDNNYKEYNDDKVISALGLHKRHQGHRPHDDDNEERRTTTMARVCQLWD